MFDRHGAYELALAEISEGLGIREESARELTEGWYFSFYSTGEPMVGAQGVIVNKRTGARLGLGSAALLDESFEAYDLGYQFYSYDLVVLAAPDVDAAIAVLKQLQLSVVDPEYRHGTVWRISRMLREREMRERLARLPCVFPGASLNSYHRILEAARAARVLRFEALEYRGR